MNRLMTKVRHMVTKKTKTKKLSNTVKLNMTMTVALCGVAGY